VNSGFGNGRGLFQVKLPEMKISVFWYVILCERVSTEARCNLLPKHLWQNGAAHKQQSLYDGEKWITALWLII